MKSPLRGQLFGYANPTPRLRILGEIYLFSCAHAISNGDRNHPMSALRGELAPELARNPYLAKRSEH